MRRLLAAVLAFALAFILVLQPTAIAATSKYYFPTVSQDDPTTDWSKVTFGSMPRLDGESTTILDDLSLQEAIGYNPSRSWMPGASLMDVIKVGDLYSFGLGEKAVGSFLGGTDPRQVSLGAFSALNAVSMKQLTDVIPELKNIPVSSLPLAQSLFSGRWDALPSQGVALAGNYYSEINEFLEKNPALANVPIGEIIQGDWNGALSKGAQVGLAQLAKQNPSLPLSQSLPLAQSIISGQWDAVPSQGVALAAKYFPEINEFLGKNPALANIPIGQIIQGDWNGALSKGAQIGLTELAKKNPQLANIPIASVVSDIASGNYRGALATGIDYGVGRLVKEFPQLKGVPIADVLGGAMSGDWRGVANIGLQYGAKYLMSDAIKHFPELANVPLGAVLNLNNFSLASVPGLAQTTISKIPGIANQSIGSIPGLGNVSVADVLSLADLLKMEFAKVDFLDEAAGKADYTLSGSTKDDQFLAEPCVGKCPHFEVQNTRSVFGVSVKGRQWVTSDQQVPGGKGILGKVNNGKEPTGMVPWGFKPNLKLVVTKVNDAKGQVELALYMRVCVKKLFVDFGCTPFFIGPIPFGSVSEKGTVLIATNAPPPQVTVPPGLQNQINNILGTYDCGDGSSGNSGGAAPDKFGYKAHKEANPSDLVTVPTPPGLGRSEALHKDAAAAFERMRRDAEKDGVQLSVISGFRDIATQEQLWKNQVAKQNGSEEAAAKLSAPPGYSEHATGYALDISGGDINLTQSFENTRTYQWLNQNAGKYGFEQSYTRSSSGGADNEPWHWRFIGTAAAKAEFSPAPKQSTAAIGNQNLRQYLNRVSAGESSGGTNIGPNPQTGAYGEYQFTPESRATLIRRTGLDPWSTDKEVRDRAALAWIDIYGQEKGVDLIGAIKSGNFALADRVLSQGQFTSLPGGPEQSPIWQNASNQQKFASLGNGGGSCAVAQAVPCPPGKTCLLLNPNRAGYIPAFSGIYGAERRGRTHAGVDLQSPKGAQNWERGPGETILAAEDGTVIEFTPVGGDCGGVVGLNHPNRGMETRYLHMVKTFVSRGQNVKRGQAIGVEGNEKPGICSGGTHLHYEIISGGRTINPVTIPHEPPLPKTALDGTRA